MVLKYEDITWMELFQNSVSVPLRGYGFEMGALYSFRRKGLLVSVPLRGYGFEMWCEVFGSAMM